MRKDRRARGAERKIVDSSGWMKPDGALPMRACIIKDQSDTGVRIIVNPALPVAEIFQIILSGENTPRRCRLQWRHGNLIGASFVT